MKLIFAIIISLLIFSTSAIALEGRVVGVSDGDTITVLDENKVQHKIRLYGIDCPEKNQDFGQKAKQFASDMVFGKTVQVEVATTDRYGRTVGIVGIDSKTLNEELIRSGYAWVYTQYCDRPICSKWKELERQSRLQKKGLWAHDNPIPPWEFRRKPAKATGDKQIPGIYHGNTQSKVFHGQGFKYYSCKNCTAGFMTRDEAVNAGYRPYGMCGK